MEQQGMKASLIVGEGWRGDRVATSNGSNVQGYRKAPSLRAVLPVGLASDLLRMRSVWMC